ncbi:protein MHF2 homolog isoform X1 [Phragmites australis]|uniref:protein MHF2 homolog isoform X1 n=1 Tax=Phragmites australis TaxID=29695 RepID=UPI002D7780E8|nr:protein MHF2 homolog isoform X1 [Phragmites australis]XP_062225940.1 protein MHF2 homolog isoform X1 [Phragmites australis]
MDEEATTGGSRAAETFDPELIHAIFKLVWSRRGERGSGDGNEVVDVEPAPDTSRRNRSTTANASALKVSCEFLRIFVTEAIQRSAFIAEAEESTVIEPTHLERVLPQLLLDF